MMGTLVNGDISNVEATNKLQLDAVGRNNSSLKYKRRKVYAKREFPQGCGWYDARVNEKSDEDGVHVGLAENLGYKMDEHVDPNCDNPLGSLVEPETQHVDKSSLIESPEMKEVRNLDDVQELEEMKTVETPKVLDEMVSLPKILKPESSDLSKMELLCPMKNLDEPVSMSLLDNASNLEQKDFLDAQSSIDTVLSDLKVQLKFSDQPQTPPVVEAADRSIHKQYPPRRRISARRDFPQGSGRNAPPLTREECQKAVLPSRDVTAVSVTKEEFQKPIESTLFDAKNQIVGGNAKRMGEMVHDGDAPNNNLEEVVTKGSEKERIELDHVKVAFENKLRRESTMEHGYMCQSESNMSLSEMKPSSISEKFDQKVGSSDGEMGKQSVKLVKDPNDTKKFLGKSVDARRAINRSPGKVSVGLGSFNEREVVQGLMAAARCPWRQAKRGFKSPTGLNRATETTKPKKQRLSVHENTKSISKKKKDEDSSEGKCTQKSPSPAENIAYEGGSELVIKAKDFVQKDDDEDENVSSDMKPQGKALSVIPLGFSSFADKDDGNSEALVTRKKVRETLRLFQAIYRKLMQEEEAKPKERPNSVRPDLLSGRILKQKNKWVNTGKQILGPVPGVEVGDEFHYRVELAVVGLHRPFQSGIDYLSRENLATSIVASGGYADDMDSSDVLKYSGQGGMLTGADKKAGKTPDHQKLVRGNLALKNSMDKRTPVRVIRGFKESKGSDSQDAKSKILTTYIYDGLYLVETFWQEVGPHGNKVYMFQLRRIPGQPELALKEVKKSRKSKVREGLCVADISQGKEKMPIVAINTIDNEKPPPFTYITKMIYPSWYKHTLPSGCGCTDGCSDSEKCLCAVKNGGEIPFNFDGAIVEAKGLVYECGPSCKCPPSCHNRVSQRGIKFPLEIFKTESRGWGVRSLSSIPSGSFICEYTGELLQDKEAEQRTINDEYLFDIGNNHVDPLREELLIVMPHDLKTSSSCENVEDAGFTIDAAHYGSIGRFVNHSCSPNLYAQNVLYDHDDKRMPHIMLFAMENIPPLQELTYDYNYQLDQVHDSDGSIKKKACYCGSAECSGRMY